MINIDQTDSNVGKSLKNRSRIDEAMGIQDELRSKSSDWSGEDEVRKWRKKR